MKPKVKFQRKMYVVARTRGFRTRYTYGETLKEAIALQGLKDGEGFWFAVFTRGPGRYGEWHGKTWNEYL